MFENEGKFCSEKFLQYVEVEGQKILCDDSQEYFNKSPEVPVFYNESKFKRAQEFFHQNIACLTTVSMAGLVSILSDPGDAMKIMVSTNKSSEPASAYKRYRDTLLHMIAWYDGNFCPGSELWKSILTVRRMHNAASLKANRIGLKRINQYMMSSTVFGFMGYALARQKEFGLDSATDEELDALVHFWRVMGFALGLDDRFSLCRESLEETRAICKTIVDKLLSEKIALKDPISLKMQFAVLDGSHMVMSLLDSETFMNFFYTLVHPKTEENKHLFYNLSIRQQVRLKFFTKMLEMCKYAPVRKCMNGQFVYMLNILKKYPEIAEHRLNGSPVNIILI